MAIIKYQLVNRTTPVGITETSKFGIGSDLIGIGSGVGTELSRSELLNFVLAGHSAKPWKSSEVIEVNPVDETITQPVNLTTSEVTAEVNEWCDGNRIP